jgi:hypothetical protein
MHQLEDATVQAFCDENDSLRGLGNGWFSTAADWWGNTLGLTSPRSQPPPTPISPETDALIHKLMTTPNESTAAHIMLVQQYMRLGVPEAQANSMAARQITAWIKATPAPSSTLPAPAPATEPPKRRESGGGGEKRDEIPQIFGVPWYFVAVGAALTVILLARR